MARHRRVHNASARLRAFTTVRAGSTLTGTEGATSFAAGETGDIYLTLVNDSRVYRRTADGTVSVVWDAGAGSVARDVVYREQRLLVVAGGVLELVDDPFDDPDQGAGHIDRGGILHAVDLASGTTEVIPLGDMLARRPVLSPDGGRVVVEAMGPTSTDLWLLEMPAGGGSLATVAAQD